jgi:hypothetical protein
VNGDQVRDTTFLRWRTRSGYLPSEVDDLLHRIAAELDVGGPVGPLIRSATFQMTRRGFDVDAVDWLLEQFLRRRDDSELAGTSRHPWRDLDVVNQFARHAAGNPDECPAESGSQRARRKSHSDERKHGSEEREYFSEQCDNAWEDFGQQPGTYLRSGWVGAASYELLTMEVQTIASVRGHLWYMPRFVPKIVKAGERSFTFRMTGPAGSSSQGLAEIAARSARDYDGHFSAKTISSRKQEAEARQWARARLPELVDKAGTPILHTSGRNFDGRACASISFPDQRWLRFLVRGTRKANTIMTAVDQAGNKIARYRLIRPGFMNWRNIVEISLPPDLELTDELLLAIAISTRWLSEYFDVPGGGG